MRTIQLHLPWLVILFSRLAEKYARFLRRITHLAVALTGFCESSNAQPGEMLRFDGNNDYIPIGNLLPSGSYTKELWISSGFFGGGSNFISGTSTVFWAPNGRLRAGHSINNIFSDVEAPPEFDMQFATWYHVALTYDATTNTLSLYQDGVLVDSGPASGTYAETNLFIGAFNPNPEPNNLYEGRMDEVRIWNVVRTAAEIANNRNCVLTGDEPGLVAYYDFNQGISDGDNTGITTLLDRSDRCVPNNGTLLNFALTGGSSNWSTTGPVLSGSCGGTYPNIGTSGNSVCLTDGDITPSPIDHTDFGMLPTRTFTIENTGSANLDISSVAITGPSASEFSVTSSPDPTVAAGGSTTFTITFTPVSSGDKLATVSIFSNDTDESPFNFDIGTFSTLPVELLSFTAIKQGNQAKLAWVTVTETNNAGFEILRSPDGQAWSKIGYVPGAGNSNIEKDYEFHDMSPLRGNNYYRIRMVDTDNNFTYSDIRALQFAGPTRVYPVPSRDKVLIESSDPVVTEMVAQLCDLQGKILRSILITSRQQEISLEGLAAGIYILKMPDGGIHKLVKQ